MPIELVWAIDLEEDFEARQFASNLLEEAKDNLARDGYVQAAVFLVTSTELHCYSVQFEGYEQKEATYAEAVQRARELHASAIITLNDTWLGEKYDPEKYQWGDAAANPKGECVSVTVSGPGLHNWSKSVGYHREQDGFSFDKFVEEEDVFIGMLGNWSMSSQRVN